MRVGLLFLLFSALVCSCGGGSDSGAADNSDLRQRAEVAERNLTRMRDAIVEFRRTQGRAPGSVDDLAENGLQFEPSDDYADLGYSFIHVSFDDDGELEEAWLIATPRGDSNALRLRMDGVKGTFEYFTKEEEWRPAPRD
jgi:hypothetical protein